MLIMHSFYSYILAHFFVLIRKLIADLWCYHGDLNIFPPELEKEKCIS